MVFGFSPALYTVIEGQETVLVAVQLLFGRTDIDFGFSVISSDVDAVGQWIMCQYCEQCMTCHVTVI